MEAARGSLGLNYSFKSNNQNKSNRQNLMLDFKKSLVSNADCVSALTMLKASLNKPRFAHGMPNGESRNSGQKRVIVNDLIKLLQEDAQPLANQEQAILELTHYANSFIESTFFDNSALITTLVQNLNLNAASEQLSEPVVTNTQSFTDPAKILMNMRSVETELGPYQQYVGFLFANDYAYSTLFLTTKPTNGCLDKPNSLLDKHLKSLYLGYRAVKKDTTNHSLIVNYYKLGKQITAFCESNANTPIASKAEFTTAYTNFQVNIKDLVQRIREQQSLATGLNLPKVRLLNAMDTIQLQPFDYESNPDSFKQTTDSLEKKLVAIITKAKQDESMFLNSQNGYTESDTIRLVALAISNERAVLNEYMMKSPSTDVAPQYQQFYNSTEVLAGMLTQRVYDFLQNKTLTLENLTQVYLKLIHEVSIEIYSRCIVALITALDKLVPVTKVDRNEDYDAYLTFVTNPDLFIIAPGQDINMIYQGVKGYSRYNALVAKLQQLTMED